MGSEMAYYHAAVESRRWATETVGYLAIFSNAANRDRGVLAGEQLDSGPAGADSRFRLVVPFLGVRIFLTYEVIRFVPDREVLLHASNGVLQATDRIVVTGTADGSTASYDTEMRLRGTLQVLAPVPRPGFRRGSARGRRACLGSVWAPAGSWDHGATGHTGSARRDGAAGALRDRFGPAVDAALEACVVPGFSGPACPSGPLCCPSSPWMTTPRPTGGPSSSLARRPGSATRRPLRSQGGAGGLFPGPRSWPDGACPGRDPGSASVSYGLADLENVDAVRAFARGFRATHDRLDALIHNAGVIPRLSATDGAGTELTTLGGERFPPLRGRWP
jgi:hypothetical protein